MIHEMRITKIHEINFAPESELEEIYQNVRTIILTTIGEVPLDRNFGVSNEMLDAPVGIVQTQLAAKIIEAVRKFEPRARICDCKFNSSTNGELDVIVKFKLAGD